MALGLLELELQAVVTCLICVLETEFVFSEGHHALLSPDPALQNRCVFCCCFVIVWGFLRQDFSVQSQLSWILLCKPGWPSNSQRPTCLCLPSRGIKGVCHFHPARLWCLICIFFNACPVAVDRKQKLRRCSASPEADGLGLPHLNRLIQPISLFRYFLVWVVLSIKPKKSCMLGNNSTTELYLQSRGHF